MSRASHEDDPGKEYGPVYGEFEDEVRGLVQEHADLTGSTVALGILKDWPIEMKKFVQIFPVDFKAALAKVRTRFEILPEICRYPSASNLDLRLHEWHWPTRAQAPHPKSESDVTRARPRPPPTSLGRLARQPRAPTASNTSAPRRRSRLASTPPRMSSHRPSTSRSWFLPAGPSRCAHRNQRQICTAKRICTKSAEGRSLPQPFCKGDSSRFLDLDDPTASNNRRRGPFSFAETVSDPRALSRPQVDKPKKGRGFIEYERGAAPYRSRNVPCRHKHPSVAIFSHAFLRPETRSNHRVRAFPLVKHGRPRCGSSHFFCCGLASGPLPPERCENLTESLEGTRSDALSNRWHVHHQAGRGEGQGL